MDIKNYSKKVSDYIDSLSDEELDAMLVRAGIENCPFEDVTVIEPWIASETVEYCSVYMQEDKLYNVGKSSIVRHNLLDLVA